jgi:hypothetical protein
MTFVTARRERADMSAVARRAKAEAIQKSHGTMRLRRDCSADTRKDAFRLPLKQLAVGIAICRVCGPAARN